MKGFQSGLLIFFGIFVLLGVLIFSGAIPIAERGSDGQPVVTGNVVVWGTIPRSQIDGSVTAFNEAHPDTPVTYVYKDPRSYEEDLLNAFAFGDAPDVVVLPQDLIFKYEERLLGVPYATFSQRQVADTYVRSAEAFLMPAGILGFPIFTDPLVMYYNQDMFENAGFALPPTTWNQFFEYVPSLTGVDISTLEIGASGVALGEFTNVDHAKDILATMILQLNNPIVFRGPDRFSSMLDQKSNVSSEPAKASLDFFTEFSNPLNGVYSWNKSKKSSQDEFVAGDLAIYFGKASEFDVIALRNPNLNFDVAKIPQIAELSNDITYADVYSIAMTRTTENFPAALEVTSQWANGIWASLLSNVSGFTPVRRDLLSIAPETKHDNIFYTSALQSRTWIDPDDEKTSEIFSAMVEDVLSGLSSSQEAVSRASTSLNVLLLDT